MTISKFQRRHHRSEIVVKCEIYAGTIINDFARRNVKQKKGNVRKSFHINIILFFMNVLLPNKANTPFGIDIEEWN